MDSLGKDAADHTFKSKRHVDIGEQMATNNSRQKDKMHRRRPKFKKRVGVDAFGDRQFVDRIVLLGLRAW